MRCGPASPASGCNWWPQRINSRLTSKQLTFFDLQSGTLTQLKPVTDISIGKNMDKHATRRIAKIPVLGWTILAAFRAKIALGYLHAPLLNFSRWLLTSRETTNFTYDLEEHNRLYLASMLSDILNVNFSTIETYITEIESNDRLKRHIADMTANSDLAFMADAQVRFGRRIGWYATARALKPRVIVETGVDKGLGSCILTAALRKNKEEGFDGKYYGTDINPEAGYLLRGDYAELGRILYGDSLQSLAKLEDEIDMFINDSDHSAEYEYQEYLTVFDKLSSHAIVLGDNSHCSDSLLKFSLETGRHFIFFQEKPLRHWYPGAGIGISFNRSSTRA